MYLFSIEDIKANGVFLSFARHTNVKCVSHLHRSLEIVFVTEGVVEMTVSGKKRILEKGMATIVMPFESHSFYTDEAVGSGCCVMVFSPDTAVHFYDKIKTCYPKNPVCRIPNEILKYCVDSFPSVENCDTVSACAVIYPIANILLKECEFSPSSNRIGDTFISALRYISEHFEDDLSLQSVSDALGIHKAHLSRLFKTCSGIHFTDYLNAVRCSKALSEIMKCYPEINLSEIAYSSGFGSIRSFNRVFKDIYGTSPSEYIAKAQKAP